MATESSNDDGGALLGGGASKWLLLTAYWVAQGVALFLLWPALVADDISNWWRSLTSTDYIFDGVCGILVFTVLQLVFVLPVNKPTASRTRGWPVRISLMVAGAAIALLVSGVLFIAHDIVWLVTDYSALDEVEMWGIFGMPALAWFVATPLLLAFCKRAPRESLLARLSVRIFLGTIIEVAALIPVDVMVRRKTSCYCGQGTFWTLLFCGTVGVFALGPAIFLPVLARRRKRWYAGRCEACGYDMSGCLNADRCPECGMGWRGKQESRRRKGSRHQGIMGSREGRQGQPLDPSIP